MTSEKSAAARAATPPHTDKRAAALAGCRILSAALLKAAALELKHRSAGDDSVHIPLVRFIEAQIRMRLAPALTGDWPVGDPIHIVLFGGTNSGKSTVLNLLLGRPVAGMDALPRFSQHPEGFNQDLSADWFDRFPSRFKDYARYVNQHPPRQTDAELRQGYRPAVALIRPDSLQPSAIAPLAAPDAVLWDCPDFSTVQARAYMTAVIDAAAMADVIVVTVTVESYLDDRGGQLLNLLIDSGAAVHVVANKIGSDPQLLADIRTNVGTNSRGMRLEPAGVHPLPLVEANSPLKRLEALLQSPQGTGVRQAVQAEADRGRVLKRRAMLKSLDFVERRLPEALAALDREANVGRHWEQAVDRHTRSVILDRYISDYIHTGRYREFDVTLARLMELLEIPVISDIIKAGNRVIRAPVNWIKRRLGIGVDPRNNRPPEEQVLTDLIDTWIGTLRSEAQQRQEQAPHPGWTGILRQLESSSFRDRIFTEGFAAGYAEYRQKLEQEERDRAEALFNKLAERPMLLNSLRLTLAGIDATALAATSVSLYHGSAGWGEVVIGPLVLKIRRWFTEKGMGAYLESQKEILITFQRSAVSELVLDKLARPARFLFQSDVNANDLDAARMAFDQIRAALMT